MLKRPYLLFLGDAPDRLAAKVALGVAQWRPDSCVGQFTLPDCQADAGLQNMSMAQARQAGAQTVIVGVANRGGIIAESWLSHLAEAAGLGMDIAAGLHKKLNDEPLLLEAAAKHGISLFDVRHPTETFPVGNGAKRTGKRLLPVGTDCSVGKMYTALALEKNMRERGLSADFRATGQTGILITGQGVSVDAVVSDFIAGSVEQLAPDNDPDHWDLIEGQGSLFHPSFAGVSMGLLHGAQPDALVLCHEPTRTHMRGLPEYPLPALEDCIELNLAAARLTNPQTRFAGVAINTAALGESESLKLLADTSNRLGLPCVDPVRTGVDAIVDALPLT